MHAPLTPPPRLNQRPARPAIPAFTLYGEAGAVPAEDMLHLESLQSRSRLHRWEIEPHVHQRLHQLIWLRAGPAEVSLDGALSRGEGPMLIAVPAASLFTLSVGTVRGVPCTDHTIARLSLSWRPDRSLIRSLSRQMPATTCSPPATSGISNLTSSAYTLPGSQNSGPNI